MRPENLTDIIECRAMDILIGALRLSGWEFTMKEDVYKAVANLSTLPQFCDKLQRISGKIVFDS